MMASAANGGGTKITEAAAVFGGHEGPAFARRYSGHDLGAIGNGLLGVKYALASRDALDQQARVLVNED
jgi:hypothetical protein